MNHLLLFESFEDIDSICKKYGIENYTINPDGTVDVDGDVYLHDNRLSKLPIKFGRVSGYFDCNFSRLTTLEGSPKWVGSNFYCNNNNLTTLEGAPSYVGGSFNCMYNKLITLEGVPKSIGWSFQCGYNPVYNIYKLFKNHKEFMDSLDWGYLRGDKIIKSKFIEACEEAGVEVPISVLKYEYI
jgi:hypothetical protein